MSSIPVRLSSIRKNYFCYLWIAPFFLVFAVFQAYPMIYGFFVSFTKWSGFDEQVFVGLENYRDLMSDPIFWETLRNTFVIWLYIVPLRAFLALILATIVNSPRVRGAGIFSFVFLLPNVTAIVVVAILFRTLLSTNGGLVNLVLTWIFGMEPINWLDSEFWSKVSIALMNIWRMTGYFMIVMLAGLQRIPKTVYEAAEVDGSTPIRSFFSITVPLMVPVIFFVVVVSTIWIFQNIADAMVLTNGGPRFSSTPLILYMYRNAFEYFKIGYASAITYVLFALLLAISSFVVGSYRKQVEDKQ
jgi:ABC-type sugar transport system permease subunit